MQRHHNQTLQAESQKDSVFPKIGQTAIQNKKKITRTYMQRRTMTTTEAPSWNGK